MSGTFAAGMCTSSCAILATKTYVLAELGGTQDAQLLVHTSACVWLPSLNMHSRAAAACCVRCDWRLSLPLCTVVLSYMVHVLAACAVCYPCVQGLIEGQAAAAGLARTSVGAGGQPVRRAPAAPSRTGATAANGVPTTPAARRAPPPPPK